MVIDVVPGAGTRHFFYDESHAGGADGPIPAALLSRPPVSAGLAPSISGAKMKAQGRIRDKAKHFLASFDERGVGYALESPASRPCTVPGVDCKDFRAFPGDMHLCATCSRADVEHLAGKKLVLTPEGGDLTDERGNITHRWMWDSRRQNSGTPAPVTHLRLNRFLTLTYAGQHDITVTFDCNGMHREFRCGASLKVRESYELSSTRSSLYRGKFEPFLSNRPSLAARTGAIVAHSHEVKEELAQRVRARGLGELVAEMEASVNAAKARVRAHLDGKATGTMDLTNRAAHLQLPSETARFNGTTSIRLGEGVTPRAAAAEATRREVPVFLRETTGAVRPRAGDGAGADLGATASSSSSTFRLAQTMGSTARTIAPVGTPAGDMVALFNSSLSHIRSDDGYGSVGGAAMHNGHWLTQPDMLRKLQRIHPPTSKRGQALMSASGKFDAWKPVIRDHGDIAFRSLDEIRGDDLARYLASEVRPDQAVLVAMLHPAESPCRRARQILEHVNGTLAAAFPDDPQYETALSLGAPPSPSKTGAGAGKAGGTATTSLCPFRIAAYDMAAASPAIVARYNLRALPNFLIFYGAKLVYAGPMGGAWVVGIPNSVRAANVLIADPNATDQTAAERHLRLSRMPFDLACGKFSAAMGKIVGTCEAAVAAINRTAEHAASVRRSQATAREAKLSSRGSGAGAGAGAAASVWSGAAPGTDTTAQVPPDYALVLLDAHCGSHAEVTRVSAAMGSASHARAGAGSGERIFAGTSQVKLVGRSLLVACWPIGSVHAHNAMCAMCTRLIHRSNRPPAASSSEPAGEWACPHCGVIHNATHERLLDGSASIAICKPVKGGTLPALVAYWRILDSGPGDRLDLGALLRDAGADTADPRVRAAIERVPLVGATLEMKGGVAADDVHLGMTHNDVIGRLLDALRKGKAGHTLPDSYVPPLGVAVSETVVRGVPLTS